jgi:hypothetical protein
MCRVLFLSLWLSRFLVVHVVAPPPSSVKIPVEKLIKQLGSDRFEDREWASRELLALESVPSELRTAMVARDPEVRRRAILIVNSIEKRLARVALAEIAVLAKAGEIDQAIERVVRWAEEDSQAEGQKALHALVRRLAGDRRLSNINLKVLLKSGDLLFRPPPRFRLKEEGPWDVRRSPRPLVYKNDMDDGFFFLCGSGVTIQGAGRGIVTSTACVKLAGGLIRNRCLIFSCGPVTVENRSGGLLIICDDDVLMRKAISGSLIIARGKVTLSSSDHCVVIAGGTIKQAGQGPHSGSSILRPNDTSGLGVIKFFDPARVGIEVTPGKGGVLVKKAHKGKPYAAVLHEGDLITSIGEAKVPSPEEFRRRLRAALAEGTKTITLTISRSGKTFDVQVRVRQ